MVATASVPPLASSSSTAGWPLTSPGPFTVAFSASFSSESKSLLLSVNDWNAANCCAVAELSSGTLNHLPPTSWPMAAPPVLASDS